MRPLLALLLLSNPVVAQSAWKSLADGIDYTTFTLVQAPDHGDGKLHVVRVDPSRADLKLILASEQRVANRTAGAWAEGLGLVVAMNAGMFETDHRSNVGYLRNGKHFNNSRWSAKYQSALVLGPNTPGCPQATMVDLDAKQFREAQCQLRLAKQPESLRLGEYATVVQNLRLIKTGGRNVWKPRARRWSEAAVATDIEGRLLFLFSRSPLSMHEFNEKILALPLGIDRAMHVEGGPEASLSIRSDSLALDLSGSFETGFNENDFNVQQWPLPNVIGVISRPTTSR